MNLDKGSMAPMTEQRKNPLDRLFTPRGIAVFGGIGRPGAFGNLITLSLIRYGYPGRLYPISTKGGQLNGLTIHKDLKDVDGPVDLASISVPARYVPGVLRSCLHHGVTGAQIHSSGFAETGTTEGIALQEEVAAIAREGIRVVGPNCFGIHSPRGGITLLPGSDFSKKPGSVALISQSGGVATDFGYEARLAGIHLSKVISFGNGCDLDVVTLLDYLETDPETEVIAVYLEGVSDGQRFLETARRVTRKKPLVIWKAGLTPPGNRAVQTHTASLAGDTHIWNGVLRQGNAISVQGLDELMDGLVALKYLKKPGPRLALVGGGGAIGVFSCDVSHRSGLKLDPFKEETQTRLRQYYPTPGNSMQNPLDTGSPVVPAHVIENSLEIILDAEPIDILIMVFLLRPLEVELPTFMEMAGLPAGPPGSYLKEMLPVLERLKLKSGKEIVTVFENHANTVADVAVEKTSRVMRKAYQSRGIPVFANVERALRGIRHAVSYTLNDPSKSS
jgi:acetate---CoA ligase (ADP-forming) subunit alpha